jgi:hypothetical protein
MVDDYHEMEGPHPLQQKDDLLDLLAGQCVFLDDLTGLEQCFELCQGEVDGGAPCRRRGPSEARGSRTTCAWPLVGPSRSVLLHPTPRRRQGMLQLSELWRSGARVRYSTSELVER